MSSRRLRTRRAAAVGAAVLLTTLTACSGGGNEAEESTSDPTGSSGSSASGSSSSTSSASSSAASPAAAATTALGPTSDDVRLCGGSASSSTECAGQQDDFATSTVRCSAEIPDGMSSNVEGSMYLNGRRLFTKQLQAGPGATGLVSYSFGQLKAPQGTYGCRFASGKTSVARTTTVSGPTGKASQSMACDATTMYNGDGVSHCRKNTPRMSKPNGVGCSSVLTDLYGRRVDARITAPGGQSVTKNLSPKLQSEAAVAFVKVPRTATQASTGKYSCTFVVDGQPRTTIPFTLA